jgi:hypothetical protein
VGRRRKGDGRRAPSEVNRLKRELGLDKQHLKRLPNYVRLRKTAQQTIGYVNGGPSIQVSWQELRYNFGGGGSVSNNRMEIPQAGLWEVKCILQLTGATVVPESNYQVELFVNGSRSSYQANHSSCRRNLSARFENDVELVAGDLLTIQLDNNASEGLDNDNGTKNIILDAASFFSAKLIGTVGE